MILATVPMFSSPLGMGGSPSLTGAKNKQTNKTHGGRRFEENTLEKTRVITSGKNDKKKYREESMG